LLINHFTATNRVNWSFIGVINFYRPKRGQNSAAMVLISGLRSKDVTQKDLSQRAALSNKRHMTAFSQSPLIAVLGPTNTGKTHLAVERLCAHSSGMIGFPLRLLAREVYDRVVAIKGAEHVALITGEEKIVPSGARWFLCTAEAMPMDKDLAFVGIDEAQLGMDPERGHVFTDRLLHARGREETMIMGSEALRPIITKLLPDADIITRPRFSTLSYSGSHKLSRLPKRSAIVAFSVEDVYAIAEMLRRQHGGAAIVMGALSPSTRNAQVKMYQDGEVDYLVATDAIGMGLNLDVAHVAFASLSKFDSRRRRRLTLAEMGQIAGRAGRHQKDGSFGLLSGAGAAAELTAEEIEHLEEHRFPAIDWLYWRNWDVERATLDGLIAALAEKPHDSVLQAAPEAVDFAIIKRLAQEPDIAAQARNEQAVSRLWEAASIPDFRKVGADHQARFITSLWGRNLPGSAPIAHARMAQEIARLDNVQGDIATLAGRVAAIRTWCYIAQKPHWVEQNAEMESRTRALEQRLSNAMHQQLMQRFVDRKTTALLRGLRGDVMASETCLAENGDVLVDNVVIGQLKGFQFSVASDSRREDRKLLLAAAERYLGEVMTDRVDRLFEARDEALSLGTDADGVPVVLWEGAVMAQMTRGKSLLTPQVKFHGSIKQMDKALADKAIARIKNWVDMQLGKHLEGLVQLDAASQEEKNTPGVRALFAQIVEAGGVVARSYVEEAVRALDKDMRAAARRAGLVFGALDIFHHALMKPGAILWRTALFAALDEEPMAGLPSDNAVHLKEWTFAKSFHAARLGFRKVGEEFLRVDMAERLVKKAHEDRGTHDIFVVDDALATSLGLSREGHDRLLEMAGFVKSKEPPPEPMQDVAENTAAQEDKTAEAGSPLPACETPSSEKAAQPPVEDPGEQAPMPGAQETQHAPSEKSVSKEDAVTGEKAVTAKQVAGTADASVTETNPGGASVVETGATEASPTYWKWRGIRRHNKGAQGRGSRDKSHKFKGKKNRSGHDASGTGGKGKGAKGGKPQSVPAGGGAFAELAALKEAMTK